MAVLLLAVGFRRKCPFKEQMGIPQPLLNTGILQLPSVTQHSSGHRLYFVEYPAWFPRQAHLYQTLSALFHLFSPYHDLVSYAGSDAGRAAAIDPSASIRILLSEYPGREQEPSTITRQTVSTSLQSHNSASTINRLRII